MALSGRTSGSVICRLLTQSGRPVPNFAQRVSKADAAIAEDRAERHLTAVSMGRANSHRSAEDESLPQKPLISTAAFSGCILNRKKEPLAFAGREVPGYDAVGVIDKTARGWEDSNDSRAFFA
jgi:hypothetical protein